MAMKMPRMIQRIAPNTPSRVAVGSSMTARPNGHSEKLASLRHWRANGSPMIVIASNAAQASQPTAIQKPQSTSQRMLPIVFVPGLRGRSWRVRCAEVFGPAQRSAMSSLDGVREGER